MTPHHLSLSHLRSLFYRISVSPRHNVTTFGFDLVSYSLNHLRADPCAAHLGDNGIRAFPLITRTSPGPLCVTYQPGKATTARTGTLNIPETLSRLRDQSVLFRTVAPQAKEFHLPHGLVGISEDEAFAQILEEIPVQEPAD